jgi:hypothetical protein
MDSWDASLLARDAADVRVDRWYGRQILVDRMQISVCHCLINRPRHNLEHLAGVISGRRCGFQTPRTDNLNEAARAPLRTR